MIETLAIHEFHSDVFRRKYPGVAERWRRKVQGSKQVFVIVIMVKTRAEVLGNLSLSAILHLWVRNLGPIRSIVLKPDRFAILVRTEPR